jgi:hypothetical protein
MWLNPWQAVLIFFLFLGMLVLLYLWQNIYECKRNYKEPIITKVIVMNPYVE